MSNLSSTDTVVVVIIAFIAGFFSICCRIFCRKEMRRRRLEELEAEQNALARSRVPFRPPPPPTRIPLTNQQEDIYNISARVQGQGQWPTHDAHVSLDNFTISNEINKHNDAPPSYDEAMQIASMNSCASAPKTTSTSTTISTTTTSTSNIN